MGLLERLKRPFGGDDTVYNYECSNCGTAFESTDANMARVRCPECESGKVTSVVREEA